MKLLMVAAEPREFSGVLRRARESRAVRLGAHWARSAKLGANEVLLVTNGAGRRRAAAAVEAAVAVGFEPEAIASIGFCGALATELDVAEVVVATAVAEGTETYQTTPLCGNAHFATGGLTTVDHVVRTAEEKRVLGATGAKVVDMEAAGVAETARRRGVPLLAVKAVTDLAGETLENDFQRVLRPDGHFDTIGVLRLGLEKPLTRIPELVRLGWRCARAAHALGVFLADCRF
jgi:adenosylhomocysteine nucleosidase